MYWQPDKRLRRGVFNKGRKSKADPFMGTLAVQFLKLYSSRRKWNVWGCGSEWVTIWFNIFSTKRP